MLRLGHAGTGAADAGYGSQLQTQAVPGLVPEGRVAVDMVTAATRLADGTVVALRRPRPRIADAAEGPLEPETRLGLRIAPPLVGLGALERIPEAEILAGTGGRPSWVVDPAGGRRRLGRFGWKASEPSIAAQVARALAVDIGLSSPLRRDPYGDCTPRQAACRAMPNGASPQLEALEVPGLLTRPLDRFVAVALAPPAGAAPSEATPSEAAGRRLFAAAGCAACHRPSFVLPAAEGRPARAIAPYTDLRLHDMGAGLAEAMPEGGASGAEWRTAPLWGLGRASHAAGDAALLHDGRARSILEAILWHGGEAVAARDRVAAMPAADRDALIAFLKSL
ncbi:MAG: di-heme oxidoredictase family protein [Dongiaceae bacterium]